ncbi:MAG: hypothetical protein IBJ18_02330 [Phycisphaerales bacterium]|nr:hypothetical protein [Phycisphaerales bacterium]
MSGRRVIILDSGGRLGNKLLNFAAVYAWCLERGHVLENPSFYAYCGDFPRAEAFARAGLTGLSGMAAAWLAKAGSGGEGWLARTADGLGQRLIKRRLRALRARVQDGGALALVKGDTIERLVELPPTVDAEPSGLIGGGTGASDVLVMGWYVRNPAGLTKYRGEILRVLQPRAGVRERARAFAASCGVDQAGVVVIAAHIRRTDYAGHLGGAWHHEVSAYVQRMVSVRDAVVRASSTNGGGAGDDTRTNVRFVVFSDESLAAAEFERAGLDVVFSRASALDDLYRMAELPGIIGPPSTFSMWASYVGGGVINHLGRDVQGHIRVLSPHPVVEDVDEFARRVLEVRRERRRT